jgi:hypothetical protein
LFIILSIIFSHASYIFILATCIRASTSVGSITWKTISYGIPVSALSFLGLSFCHLFFIFIFFGKKTFFQKNIFSHDLKIQLNFKILPKLIKVKKRLPLLLELMDLMRFKYAEFTSIS